MRPFDWTRICPEDFTRQFPPIAGPGRGEVFDPEKPRKEREEPEEELDSIQVAV